MHWTAPTEKDAAATSLEKRLWDAADQFRANSGPILGLAKLWDVWQNVQIARRRIGELLAKNGLHSDRLAREVHLAEIDRQQHPMRLAVMAGKNSACLSWRCPWA